MAKELTDDGDSAKRGIAELSADSRAVYQLLRERGKRDGPGTIIKYSELNDLIGRDVRGAAFYCLSTARSMCLRDNEQVWSTIRGVGVKLLSGPEIVNGIPPQTIGTIHRATRRAIRKVGSVEFATLGADDKVKHNAALSLFGAFKVLSQPKKMLAIEAKVRDAGMSLPLAKTLEFFKT